MTGRSELHNSFKYINLIGIEFEGGWNDKPVGLKSDGSIAGITSPHYGEVISKPSTLDDLLQWVKFNIPSSVNYSCGTHVHVSFKSVDSYLQLTKKDFYEFFLRQMEDWGHKESLPLNHEFWKRLEGENSFCKRVWTPESQFIGGDTRYTHLNFAYYKYKTIECRLFPGFTDPSLVESAVKILTATYESWLDQQLPLTSVYEELIPCFED